MASRVREDILDAAAQILRDRGLVHMTTREVARRARCAEGSIFKHFETKSALLEAVLQERVPEFGDVVAAVRDPGAGQLQARVAALAAALLRFYAATAPMLATMGADADLRTKATFRFDALTLVREYLSGEQRARRIRSGAPIDGTALALVGACQYAAVMGLLGTPWEPDKAAQDITAAVLAALAR